MGLADIRTPPRSHRRPGAPVTDPGTPGNNLNWRVTVLERTVERLEGGKSDAAVVADRVTRLSGDIEKSRQEFHSEIRELRDDDIRSLREELATQRRILIGAFISIATGLILAYVLGGGSVG